MVTVKCIKNYHDLMLNRRVIIGEELEVDKVRAKELEAAHVAITLTTTTPKEVDKPKKGRAKKEA